MGLNQKARKIIKVLAIILGGAVLVIAILLAIFVYRAWRGPFRTADFDAQRWAAAWDCGGLPAMECEIRRATCTRGAMLGDLIDRYLTPVPSATGYGTPRAPLDRDAVNALLGPSDFLRAATDGSECEHRLIGMCSGFRVDYDSLFVCFDGQGDIRRAGNVQH
ncbi:MAG: hypothetical protein R3D60_11095 [Paracoccaceae bacterium]